MAMEMGNYSLADIKAVTDNDDGWGGNGGAWWIIILFLFLFGANGFGGRNNEYGANAPATQGQMTDQFNFEAIRQGQADIVTAVKDQNANVISTVKDVNYNNLNQIRDIEAMVSQNAYQQQQCCCETNRNLDSIKYENCRNTRDIVDAIQADGEATRDLITQNIIQNLRDQVQDSKIYASNCAQTNEILTSLGRYVTNPPCPQPYGCYNYNGCGCNTCGC